MIRYFQNILNLYINKYKEQRDTPRKSRGHTANFIDESRVKIQIYCVFSHFKQINTRRLRMR